MIGRMRLVPISDTRRQHPMQIDRTATYVDDLEGIRAFYEGHFDA